MRKGFTLIELMIVIAIIAIIAAIAIPNLLESRLSAAETAASASLRSGIFSGQETFRAANHNDMDYDNKGEFGHLGQLAGERACWGRGDGTGAAGPDATPAGTLEIINTSYDSPDVAVNIGSSTVNDIQGYRFASYLNVASDSDSTTPDGQTQINSGENYFCAVAVPIAFGDTGRSPFLITQTGSIQTRPGSDVWDDDPDVALNDDDAGAYGAIASATTKENRDIQEANAWGPEG